MRRIGGELMLRFKSMRYPVQHIVERSAQQRELGDIIFFYPHICYVLHTDLSKLSGKSLQGFEGTSTDKKDNKTAYDNYCSCDQPVVHAEMRSDHGKLFCKLFLELSDVL